MRRNESVIPAYEAKTHLAALLVRVEGGEELTITRHGLPVARLVPVHRKTTPAERRAAVREMRELASGLSLGGLRVKDLVAAGRR